MVAPDRMREISTRWSILILAVFYGLIFLAGALAIASALVQPKLPGLSSVLLGEASLVASIFVAGVIGVWLAVPTPTPTRLSFSLDGSWTRVRRGLKSGFAVGMSLSIITLIFRFAYTTLSADGWSVSQTLEYVKWTTGAIFLTIVLAISLGARSWTLAPPTNAIPAGPEASLRNDRIAALAGAAIAGVLISLLITPAVVATAVVGSILGEALTNWPGWPGHPNLVAVANASVSSMKFFVARPGYWPSLIIVPSTIVATLVLLSYAWPRFAIARLTGFLWRMPLRLVRFLSDANERGVLRRSGNAYQFRHVRMQELLNLPEFHLSNRTGGWSGGRSARRTGLLAATALIVIGAATVPFIVPRNTGRPILAANVVDARWSPDEKTITTASMGLLGTSLFLVGQQIPAARSGRQLPPPRGHSIL